jgi:hypothetical protein
MKSRSASEWVKAYDLKNFFTVNDIAYQLVPPHCAERAIQTFKEHFVTVLSSVDPAFPLHLW